MISNKKDFLKFIKGAGVGVYGAPATSSTVKFQFATSIATAAASQTAGALTFAADSNGNAAIYAQGTLVSSKIQNVVAAAASGAKHGGKTVTVTYIGDAGSIQTATFDVIDEAALEAYFSNSKTIALNGTTNKYEVITDGTTILVDESNGLKSGLKIAYVAEHDNVGAQIQLQDKDGNIQGNAIEVSNIVGDGVLKDSIYHKENNVLELRFGNGKTYSASDPTTYTKVDIDMQELIDINDVFIGTDSSIYLDAHLDASTVTLNTKMQDPSTADSTHTGLADALKVKQYVDSKTTDLAVSAAGDNYVDASVDANNKKKINVAATDKTKTAVALAETAVQSVVEGTSTETYVALNVSAKSDASVITITTDDSALSAKITEIDSSISDISTRLANKTAEIDSSIDRLDASVTAIETAIEAMDADLSVNTLDGSIGITLTETNGKVTAIGVTATEATTTFTAAVGETPASLVSTKGILTGAAIEDIVDYVNAKSSALDSSVTGKDVAEFVTVNTVQTDGALSAENVTVVYGDYDKTNQTNGIATTGATKTYVDAEITAAIDALDLANDVADSSAHDTKNYVKTVISESNGIVKNESVTVTYGDYNTHAAGVATVEDTSVFVQNQITTALTWTIL